MALLAGAVLGAGVSGFTADAAPSHGLVASRRAAPRLSRASVEALAASAVWRARVDGCTGGRSGTVTAVRRGVEATGLTNAHVVEGARTVSLSAGAEGPLRSEVRETVQGRDAALVDVPAGAAALAPGTRPDIGTELLVAGYPGGGFEQRWGVLRDLDERVGRGGLSKVMLIDVPAYEGLSGGAVVDRTGAVVGIVAARDPETGWTVAYPLGEVLGRPGQDAGEDCRIEDRGVG